MLSSHGHDLMQILEINQVVGFVLSYLHLVLLAYFSGFLLSEALIGWFLESLFQKKGIISVWATTDITR